jgi:F-type H+-transporting ATPase subunit delta
MDPAELSMGELYAQSLLDTLDDNGQAEEVAAELDALTVLLNSIPDSSSLLAGWSIPADQRISLVQRLFAGRVSEKVEAFLTVLNRHGRMLVLSAAVRGFRKLLDRREGKIDVRLTTATPLDDSQLSKIRQELETSLAGKAQVQLGVDENLLGGAVVRIGDRVYDASLRAELLKFKDIIAARRMNVKTQ